MAVLLAGTASAAAAAEAPLYNPYPRLQPGGAFSAEPDPSSFVNPSLDFSYFYRLDASDP